MILGITLLIVLFLGYLGKYYRFCDVLSNFKEQIFLAALFLLIATLFSKILQKTNLTVLGLIIVVTLIDILPWYYFDHGQEKGSHFFRVSLINVLKRNKNYEDVIKLVDNLAPDILVFMEIDDKWFEQLLQLDAKSAQNPLIIVADLNASMWSPFYIKLIENTQMKNARKGFGIHGTYPAPLATISGVPIDHILLDEFFCCQDFKTGPYIGSDHLPIWADISF